GAGGQGAGSRPYDTPVPVVVTDPELTTASVETLALRPWKPTRTVADLRRKLLENLGMWMVNRRMEQRIQEGTAPYQTAGVRQGVFLGMIEQIDAEAEAASTS